jgi:hypothetical protein
MSKRRSKSFSPREKKQKIPALFVIFVVEIFVEDLNNEMKRIEVPATYFGVSFYLKLKRKLKREKSISHHFEEGDMIKPKSYKNEKVLFLGPRKKSGTEVSYPNLYSDARYLEINKKYKICSVKRRS